MKAHNILLAAFCIALVGQGVGSAEPSAPDPAPTKAKLAAAPAANPESALKPEMSADAVIQLMGRPDEVRPMKAPSGKAEVWVYKRRVNPRADRVEIGSIPITVTVIGADGKAHQQVVGQTAQYANVQMVTEETIELLMFNDQYITHKVSRRELKNYG